MGNIVRAPCNHFQKFYDTEVRILEIKKDDYSGETTQTILNSVMADVQPFGGGLAEKVYGLTVNSNYRIFTDKCEHLIEGNYADIDGQTYQISYVENWKMGSIAILAR